MSIVTSTPQLVYPLSGPGVSLSSGASAGANPAAWTPLFTTSGLTSIAGIVVRSELLATFAHLDIELAIGIGAVPAEIGCFGYYGANSGIGGPSRGPQPQYPVGTIPTATLVSTRLRSSQAITLPFSFLYYVGYDGDVADYNALTLGRLPAMAPATPSMVSITPSAFEWVASDWVPVGDALEVDTDVVALLMTAPVSNVDCRWELGKLAAPGGAVEHVTTFPSATQGAGRAWFSELPKPYPFVAGEQVHINLRKSGTSVTVHKAALTVFRHAPAASEGVIGPLMTVTFLFRPPVV